MVRSNNEDTAIAEESLFAVADGMGGHAAGEVASRIAIDAFREAASEGLVEAVVAANRAVLTQSERDPALRGMGTTLCALTLLRDGDSEQIELVNVGDSRGYLLRDRQLSQVTEDHNVPGELLREGRLTATEARYHPQRNIVTRILGTEPEVDVDRFLIDPFRGDRFLLCSDGLSDELLDDAIEEVLVRVADPEDAAAELVRLARESGGHDNITVVVVDVVDDGGKAATASSALAGSGAGRSSTAMTTISAPVDGGGTSAPAPRVRTRRFTWRNGAFLLALVVVIAVAASAVWWFGRGSYFVEPDAKGRLTVYQGRPDGVLWLQPTVARRTHVREDDLSPAARSRVEDHKLQPSADAAEAYIERLPTTTSTSSTTSTTSTSTTLLPTTAP
jgi:protein phosphatase